jgi:hypothetical protein
MDAAIKMVYVQFVCKKYVQQLWVRLSRGILSIHSLEGDDDVMGV